MEKRIIKVWPEKTNRTYFIDENQKKFFDEETGYEIYVAEDGSWIAYEYYYFDNWVLVKAAVESERKMEVGNFVNPPNHKN